jgi:thioredoxin-related protein
MRYRLVSSCAVVAALMATSWIVASEGAASLWRRDAYTAWKASQASGRPIVYYVTSPHCPYCDLMEQDTLADPAVRAVLRKSFEPARVYVDRDPALAQNLRVQAYPTTVVVSSSNRIVESIQGYVPPREFQRRLTEVAHVHATVASR